MKNNYLLFLCLLLASAKLFSQSAPSNVQVSINTPIICNYGDSAILNASFPTLNSTTSYTVSSITYNPAFPYIWDGVPGHKIDATGDDKWSPSISLPFSFCFYGVNYSQVLIGTNGVVTFDTAPTQLASGSCAWSFNSTIPNAAFPIKNAIYGVYQDTNIALAPLGPIVDPAVQNVNYYFLNQAPNRVLVINFNELPQYSCNNTVGLQTSQIILYESTNIIDINVKRRTSCTGWNSGSGLIGIQNQTGTAAVVPAGFNTGSWSATNLAWRFAPSGTAIPTTVAWQLNGVLIPSANNPSLPITAFQPGQYSATVTYQSTCGGDFSVSGSQTVFVMNSLPTTEPNPISLCAFSQCPYTVNINQDSYLLNGSSPNEFSVAYYETLADANNTVNPILNTNAYFISCATSLPKTIYVRIESYITGCASIKQFEINTYTPSGAITYSSLDYSTSNTDSQPITTTGLTPGGIFLATPAGLSINPTTGAITPSTSSPGSYQVTYEITGACPNSTTTQVNIIVTACVVIATNSGPICSGTTINLFASTIPGATYQWTGPNGFTSNVQNPTNVPAPTDAGSYVYQVTATNGSDICSGSTFVEIATTPVAIMPNTMNACSSGTNFFVPFDLALNNNTIVGSGVGLTVSYYETQSDAENNVNALSIPYTNLSNPQTLYVRVQNDLGCYSTTTLMLNVTLGQSAQVNQPMSQVLCNGSITSQINFTSNDTVGTTTYSWTNSNPSIGLWASGTGDISSFIATNNSPFPIVAAIVVTATNSAISSNCNTSTVFTITVNPNAQMNQLGPVEYCNGATTTAINFNTNNTGGVTTYNWTNSNPSIGMVGTGNGGFPSFTAMNLGNSPIVATIVVTPIFTNLGVTCAGPSTTFTITVSPTPCNPITTGFHLKAFLDMNNNGSQDSGEINFPFGQFVYQVNNSIHNVATLSGTYDIFESNPNTIYTLSYMVNPILSSYFFAFPNNYSNVHVVSNGGMITYNFPITLNSLTDLGITNIPISSPVPGFDFQHLIMYSNNGLATTSGTINFTKDPSIGMVSTSEPSAILNSNGFSHNFSNLNPFETKLIYVTMHTPTIPTVHLGQLIFTNATINPSVGVDMVPSNNSSMTYQYIFGSFDPNDIMESHGRDIVFADFTAQDYLYYTIRFENTGNGNAVNIQVDNTLDVKLDEATMEMVSSSHDYVMDRVGSSVNWKFANIQLPPSVAETTTGKGYIMYKIKPKPGYAIGDIIPNSAAIYFDFNPAIITNTFNTEFTAPLGIVDFESDEFVVYPNPASEKITVQLKNKNDGIAMVQIYDQLGRIIQTERFSNALSSGTIQLNNLSKGIYFIEVTSQNNLIGRKKMMVK